jgi:5-methylcytosine-specific restriction endonuclease McrA
VANKEVQLILTAIPNDPTNLQLKRRLEDALQSDVSSVASEYLKTPLGDVLKKLWESQKPELCKWRKILRDFFEKKARCPLCDQIRDMTFGEGDRQDVDHFLPRSSWPELSMVATNLIPICTTCNSKLKKTQCMENGERLFLHPYFDEFIDKVRVNAEVVEVDPLQLNYSLDTSLLSDEEANIAKTHFERLALNARYLFRVNEEALATLQKRIRRLIQAGKLRDADDVQAEIRDSANDYRTPDREHCFEAAALAALATCDSYASAFFTG